MSISGVAREAPRQISTGQFGTTFLEFDIITGNRYIVKYIEKDLLDKYSLQPTFHKYIQSVQNISSPFIQHFNEITETENQIILKRLFITGLNLYDYVAQMCQIGDVNILYVFWKVVVRTFQHLHRYCVYPNFIKPSNIFVISGNKIVITDLYQQPNSFTASNKNIKMNELAFFPPEFITGNYTLGAESDFWFLGVLLYFMVSGKIPWHTKNIMHMSSQITKGDISSIEEDEEIENDVKVIISKILKIEPFERITADDILNNKNPGVHVHGRHHHHHHRSQIHGCGNQIQPGLVINVNREGVSRAPHGYSPGCSTRSSIKTSGISNLTTSVGSFNDTTLQKAGMTVTRAMVKVKLQYALPLQQTAMRSQILLS
ncbi:AGC family protein kinase [Tritrichomonas foetus]|uniref:AGC family protein kinase n=1 Tax=Tritrichomonas foetus TaxID=1144522 RepID=A0A1J4K941_9EUKA|nr:AGC family protein kinase [Tritrichomonas foetus]|eukprot:OHT07458.1 AGC family protein kinase [Tritrichomonas foetus]